MRTVDFFQEIGNRESEEEIEGVYNTKFTIHEITVSL